jgi:tetratricopeptide (TPR) repeat protein
VRDDLSLLWWFVSWQLYKLAVLVQGPAPHYSMNLCSAVASWNAGSNSVLKQRLHARALVTMAITQELLGHSARSVEINETVIAAYSQSKDSELRTHVAWAMVNKGFDLMESGKEEEAIDLFKDLAGWVPPQAPYLAPLAQGLNNWSAALGRLGRYDEKIAMDDRIAALLRDRAHDPELAHLLAWASVTKGTALAFRGDFADAITTYDAVLHRWWKSRIRGPSDRLQEALAAALRHRSEALIGLREYEAAVSDVDRVVDRYGSSRTIGIQEEVAWAMVRRAFALEQLGRRAQALATCDSAIRRYGRSAQPQVLEAVKGAAKLRQALIGA